MSHGCPRACVKGKCNTMQRCLSGRPPSASKRELLRQKVSAPLFAPAEFLAGLNRLPLPLHMCKLPSLRRPGCSRTLVSSWTKEVAEALRENWTQSLVEYEKQAVSQIGKLVQMLRGWPSHVHRCTMDAFVVLEVLSSDIITELTKAGVEDDTQSSRLPQLRYYWEDGNVPVRAVTTAATRSFSRRWSTCSRGCPPARPGTASTSSTGSTTRCCLSWPSRC
jgi:hypothetical protein